MGFKNNRGSVANILSLWFFANTLLWPFSVDMGGFKLGLNVAVLAVAGAFWMLKNNSSISFFSAKLVFWLAVFFLFSFIIAITGPCEDKFVKFLSTAPVMFLLALVGLEIGWRATASDWLQLEILAKTILLIAFLGFLFEAFLPGLFPNQDVYRLDGKFSGFFSEPSHVAISLFPSIVILLASKRPLFNRFGTLALIGLVLFSRSSSLIVLILLWLIYQVFVKKTVKFTRRFVFIVAIIISAVIAAVLNYEQIVGPIEARLLGLFGSSEIKNISSLVYAQGLQDAWKNLQRTNGLGLGFNMMGCLPLPDVPARQDLESVFHLDGLNAEDGSFLFSKIVSETGFIGLLAIGFVFLWWVKLEKKIRKLDGLEVASVLPMYAALLFIFLASIILRSAGYFSVTLMLMIPIAAGIAKQTKRSKL